MFQQLRLIEQISELGTRDNCKQQSETLIQFDKCDFLTPHC